MHSRQTYSIINHPCSCSHQFTKPRDYLPVPQSPSTKVITISNGQGNCMQSSLLLVLSLDSPLHWYEDLGSVLLTGSQERARLAMRPDEVLEHRRLFFSFRLYQAQSRQFILSRKIKYNLGPSGSVTLYICLERSLLSSY